MDNVKKVALAYSGGLDTSIIIPWLKENYGCDVVAVAVDVGQADETSGLADKAYRTGASDFHLILAKAEFASDSLLPFLTAGPSHESDARLAPSPARPPPALRPRPPPRTRSSPPAADRLRVADRAGSARPSGRSLPRFPSRTCGRSNRSSPTRSRRGGWRSFSWWFSRGSRCFSRRSGFTA